MTDARDAIDPAQLAEAAAMGDATRAATGGGVGIGGEGLGDVARGTPMEAGDFDDLGGPGVLVRLASEEDARRVRLYESAAIVPGARYAALEAEASRLRAERDAILRWSIRHAGYIGTTEIETMPPTRKWWAVGDRGRVLSDTAEGVVRVAAGLPAAEGGPS